MAKNFFDELTGYRVKVERDGKELLNVPSLLALPGLLLAPKTSIIGMIAAPLLGCSVHVENENGQAVDLGKVVRNAADTVADTASTAAKTVRDEISKAWDALSADDPGKEDAEEACAGDAEDTEAADGQYCADGAEDTEATDEPCCAGDAEDAEADGRKNAAEDIPTIHVVHDDEGNG